MTGAPSLADAQPVLWTLLGYRVEAASMLASLTACLSLRIWICLKDAPDSARTRAIDITVTSIALLFSTGWVVLQRPSPFFALLSGSGFGALGTGIVALSLRWVKRLAPLADEDSPPLSSCEQSLPQGEAVRLQAKRSQHSRHKRRH